jgi:hypothetical protein
VPILPLPRRCVCCQSVWYGLLSLFQDLRSCPTLLRPSLSSQIQTDNNHPDVAEECADSRQRDISNLDILVGPLVEQLDAANLRGDILGQDGVALGLLDFDFSGVRHFGDVMRKGGREMGGWRGRQECRFAREVRLLSANSDRPTVRFRPGIFRRPWRWTVQPSFTQSLTSDITAQPRPLARQCSLSSPLSSYSLYPITLDRVCFCRQ